MGVCGLVIAFILLLLIFFGFVQYINLPFVSAYQYGLLYRVMCVICWSSPAKRSQDIEAVFVPSIREGTRI